MTSFFDIANEELKTSQPVRKSYFELGKSLYVHGMYEKAKTQFFEALNVQDESVEDWRLYTALFDVCSQTGKAEEARDHFFKNYGHCAGCHFGRPGAKSQRNKSGN